ncbi:MAG: hypothetical protein ACYS9X_07765 [Planctomycetota bacterium]|jgi:hypothetical protein
MGAPGGAVYLGHVFGWIANDLRSIIERMGHVPVRGPDAVLGDVPLLIKALELHEEEVRADARRALTRIAGEDLGDRPEPWREWWDSEGRQLRERRRTEIGIERLFASFRGAVMSGKWQSAAARLGFDARDHGHDVDLTEVMRRNRRALRKAWRDAGIAHIEIDGDRAKLDVGWGKLGFESRELVARRIGDEWRFEAPPWGARVVRQPPPPAAHARPGKPIKLEQRRLDATAAFMIVILGAIGLLLALLVWMTLGGGWTSGRGGRAGTLSPWRRRASRACSRGSAS